MAPKALGGAGNKTAQDYVAGLWPRGSTEEEIRQQLKRDGYKAGRISQLIKATRPADGQAGPAAAVAPAPKQMARPAAAERVTAAAAMKKPAAASCTVAPEAGGYVVSTWKKITSAYLGHGLLFLVYVFVVFIVQ